MGIPSLTPAYLLFTATISISSVVQVKTAVKMLRRKPTRIELKLDDLEEYDQLKKEKAELEKKKEPSVLPEENTNITPTQKAVREAIHERIGITFEPQPLPQPSRLHHL